MPLDTTMRCCWTPWKRRYGISAANWRRLRKHESALQYSAAVPVRRVVFSDPYGAGTGGTARRGHGGPARRAFKAAIGCAFVVCAANPSFGVNPARRIGLLYSQLSLA